MTGDLSSLAVGLLICAAIGWVGNEVQHELFDRNRILWHKTPRLLRDVRECDSHGAKHPLARFLQNPFWGGIAQVSWIDFFESKGFGASFSGFVSILTLYIAGANARSIFALTLSVVVGYWLIFDKAPLSDRRPR